MRASTVVIALGALLAGGMAPPARSAGPAPAAAGAASQQPLVPQRLRCTGNEPSWAVEIGNRSAAVTRLSMKGKETATYTGDLTHFDFLDPPWAVWRGTDSRIAGKALALTLRKEECRDSMADGPPMPWRAVVSFQDGTAAVGCCRAVLAYDAARAPVAALGSKPADDWTRWLAALAPALQACVAGSKIDVVRVPAAAPMNHGKALVELQDAQGALFDCIADLGARKVDSVKPFGPDQKPLPGAGQPAFLPVRANPPLVSCGRLERVLDGKKLIGYLHYGPC